jgi:hypothetical protein
MWGSPSGQSGPQGLKPVFLSVLNGTAEAVPYPKPESKPRLKGRVRLIHRGEKSDVYPTCYSRIVLEILGRYSYALHLCGITPCAIDRASANPASAICFCAVGNRSNPARACNTARVRGDGVEKPGETDAGE